MGEIIVDYTQIRKKAEEVDLIINDLNGYQRQLEEAWIAVGHSWKGTASEEMQKKLTYLLDRVNEDMNSYRALRNGLNDSADFWERKEKSLKNSSSKKEP